MKRAIRFAATLYPRAWRARYGPEFDALLEQTPESLNSFVNILWGAIKMNLTASRIAASSAYAGLAFGLVYLVLQTQTRGIPIRLAEWSLPLLGVPLIREGNYLLTAFWRISASAVCDGIAAPLLLAALFWLYGILFEQRPGGRWVLLIAVAPAAIGACAGRVIAMALTLDANFSRSTSEVFGWAAYVSGALVILRVFHLLVMKAGRIHRLA